MSRVNYVWMDWGTGLFSVTACYADGRMIEQTFAAASLHTAETVMRMLHPKALVVEGEYLMRAVEFVT